MIATAKKRASGATQIGYPVILKASAGGGGRGMRVVRNERRACRGSSTAAQSEAATAFGNGDLYMEKFIERPRHIEFQVLADEHGHVDASWASASAPSSAGTRS